jgi:peptidoglycan/xylan/chitin deacetylase (PgdA/CDA1 family)
VSPLLLLVLWPHSPLAGIGVLALSHLLVVYPTLRPNVQWLGPVITRFATERREMWLTIDDGPTEDTHAVLALFARHGVRATFFVKGALVERHPELVSAMIAGGHSVANHSQTHPSGTFWCLLPKQIASEIDRCNDALSRVAGVAPRWFRAPVGMKNPAVHPILERRGMRLIGWSVRSFDGVAADPENVVARVAPHFAPGAILVMHQGREHSPRVLDRVIAEAKSQGYAFVVPADEQLQA